MSVALLLPTDIILYVPQPREDSPLPIGEWRAAGSLGGDASGGIASVTVAPPSAEQANRFLWSWEGASIRYDAALALFTAVLFYMVTAETIGGLSREAYGVATQMVATGTIPRTATLPIPWDTMRRIHGPDGGLTNSYTIEVDLNTNLVNYYFALWGYVWHPQVRRLAGGPKRP